MKRSLHIKVVLLILASLFSGAIYAQEEEAPEENKREVIRTYRENIGVTYDKSWAFTFKYRTDGWQIGADYNKTINYFKSSVFQFDIGELKHFKQTRQSKDPSGGIFGFNGIRPFVYGKQNSFYVAHANYGRRHLLAERARKNGVMVQFQYTGGISLGILKGYYLDIIPLQDDGSVDLDRPPVETGYVEGSDNGFTNFNRIVGYSGFAKGFGDLGFQPGLNANISFQFDWSNQDSFIKALEGGFHADVYFWNVPIMVSNNRFYFMSVYVGILLGKKKN
ncbi:MAG: hypothetical protein KDD32_01220 [Bacteroidetes bacterium]|nr:hypothetical protein [Bacteroidota bacterium]